MASRLQVNLAANPAGAEEEGIRLSSILDALAPSPLIRIVRPTRTP